MSDRAQLLLLGLLAATLVGLAVWIVTRIIPRSPEKREKKRRLDVNRRGRLGDATVTEAGSSTIFYEYSVHGVHYTASQDVSALPTMLPAEPERLIGNANMKYMVNNPANSILLCEDWSGLRIPSQAEK
jgi:hypothetical protein